MRPLFVCPALGTGGAERSWALLIRALSRRGDEPALLTLNGEGRFFHELRAEGVAVHSARLSRRSDVAGLGRALRFAARGHDAVVTQGVNAQVVGEAIATRARVPHVVNEHTPCASDGALLAPRRHQGVLIRLVAPRVDRVVAVARAQVAPLAARGYRPERIRVVPNGVFPEQLRPAAGPEGTRAALGVKPEDFLALALTALRPEKRVDAFVDAIALARRSEPRVRGLVAGTGRELDRVRARVEESDGGVHLLGERSDVADLLLAADVLCLPSAAEALPMVVLEAMALARPVVASKVGGTPEAVVPGETGFLVGPGDAGALAEAILTLSSDPGAARTLGEAGRERQRSLFGGERMVDGYVRALEEACSAA